MDSKLQMGRLLAIVGVYLSIFFYVAFFVTCITMGYFFHVWGGVGVGLLFFCCFVISICTELLCFGRGI